MTQLSRTLFLFLSLLVSSAALADANLLFSMSANRYPDRVDVTFAMVNHGPDVARNAVLTFEVPEGVTVTRLGYGAGDVIKQCDSMQRPIRCEVGDMHVGAPFHYGSIELRAPIANATYTVKGSLLSETPDPSLANNSHSFSWETRIEADLNIFISARTERIDPGESATFTANVCNETRDNRPPTVRAEFTAAGGTVTSITPASGYTCRIEGSAAVCTRAELPHGCSGEPFRIGVRASSDRRGGEVKLMARVSGDLADPDSSDNENINAVPVYRWITVDSTADDGPGSLRQAITDANAGCTPGPCRIVFEIPKPVPAEGWFTITPLTPLPSITADRVTLEGDRQTTFTGNTNQRGPEIAIDGRLARRGIRMLALCEGVVNGLAIGNFDEDQGLWFATGGSCGGRPDRREVKNNHIGAKADGFDPMPNQRGLRLDFAEGVVVSQNVIANNQFSGIWMWRGSATITSNFIGQNGASGIFLGPEIFFAKVNDNVIRDHGHMGIAVARAAEAADVVEMRRNSMRNNFGIGIDWGLDGVSPVDTDDRDKASNAPVLLSAQYDAASNMTSITVTVNSKPLGPDSNSGAFDFFTNDGPDGDGEWFIGSGSTSSIRDQTITITVPGDHRGKWINATWTRTHFSDFGSLPYGVNTSELSNSVLVQ